MLLVCCTVVSICIVHMDFNSEILCYFCFFFFTFLGWLCLFSHFSTFQVVSLLPVLKNFSINHCCPSVNHSCTPCRILTAPALRLREDRALHYLAQTFQASLCGAGPWAKPFERSKRCPALRAHRNGRDLCRDLITRTNLRCTSNQCSIPRCLNLILFHLLH